MGYNDYDGFEDDEDNEDETPQGPKALRDAQKAAAKRNRDLEAQLAKLTSQLAQRNLKDVLESKSLRPGLAKTIAAEGVDATDPAAIEAWLSDTGNQEDFAFSLPTDGSPTPPAATVATRDTSSTSQRRSPGCRAPLRARCRMTGSSRRTPRSRVRSRWPTSRHH
jgi:hypothetical protein